MNAPRRNHDPSAPAMQVHLLGVVDFDACLALKQRLVYELSGQDDGQASLLVCEHPPRISIGRSGSRRQIRLNQEELTSRKLPVTWVNRGGPALLHLPGQLAVYPIVPLQARGWSVGEYLTRLAYGLQAGLEEQGVQTQTHPKHGGLWARSGQLAALGVAVKRWTTYYGAYVNVTPDLSTFSFVHSDSLHQKPMSSLAAERRQRVQMTKVREALVRHVAAALDYERCHVYAGHPLLSHQRQPFHEATARVG